MSVQRRNSTETVTAPPTSGGSCWTAGGSAASRLTNAPVMIATMCSAADALIFGRIVEVVEAERVRREAATA